MPKPSDPEKFNHMFTDDIKFLQKIVIFHPNDPEKFLILKRSESDRFRAGNWDLTGGNVLYGEKHNDSLRKEIEEETKLEMGEFSPAQIITKHDKEKEVYIIFVGYYAKAKTEKVEISEEHSDYRWVTKNEFKDLATEEEKFLVDLVDQVYKVRILDN